MSSHDCLFCKIISGDISATVVDQNDDILVIKDIHPKAPIHYLIIPKIHIKNIQDLQEENSRYIAKMMLMAKKLSQKLSGDQSFRLIMNNGAQAGQSVFHMHCHFLSGKVMNDF
ncbi:HIT domain-containing protein [bacterium]|nr:HIT domain-containing protein [bacterium]